MKSNICKISLVSLIMVCFGNMPADARVNIKNNSNRSYADAYNQVANIRYQQEYMDATAQYATTASDTGTLPVMVEDKALAESILNNTSSNVNTSDLEACSMIYPNGVFRWGLPESGVRRNQTPQCIAVVELRDANSGAVLATTTLAAGDTMKCNIEMFPQSGFMPALGSVELPADAAPTLADVEAVMNEEQKQNAGFKIAAGAIIAGVAGNLLAPKQAGDTKLIGTSTTAITDTVIGATAGAGIMAASTYSGKVAGDTIKSTAVNAASGMVVGNMMAGVAGSDSVLATTKCKTKNGEKDCIIGNIKKIGSQSFEEWGDANRPSESSKPKNKEKPEETDPFYTKYATLISRDETNVLRCHSDENNTKLAGCTLVINKLFNTEVKTQTGSSIALKNVSSSQRENIIKYTKNGEGIYTPNINEDTNIYYLVTTASITEGEAKHAYAVFDEGLPTKPFGFKKSDWDSLSAKARYYRRNSDGTVDEEIKKEGEEILSFEPLSRDATDGSVVDLSNQARAKGTLIGTAAGGALGGFAGYQGAKNEIEERWLTATREYQDSLSNFVCMTGGRYLAPYNSFVDIPELKKSDQ